MPVSFIFYDTETTGTAKAFDQILQFGAIRTNPDLEITDKFEVRSRLLPHVIPAPAALHLTGVNIGELVDSARPSHYEMVCKIRTALGAWCPSIFLGFNSIRFDEEFLRQAFYQCLHPPYLTNTQGSARGDVLHIVKACMALHPEVLNVPRNGWGKPVFELDKLAPANGFPHANAHEAIADAEATIHLCRIIRDKAPDLWSRYLRFAQKAAVVDYISDEEVFTVYEFYSQSYRAFPVTRVGQSPKMPNVQYCLDLRVDIDALRSKGVQELIEAIETLPKPLRRLKANSAPVLCPIDETPADVLQAWTEDALRARACTIRADQEFCQRLVAAGEATEKVYGPSPHVEQQLYEGGFWSRADDALLAKFHQVPWEERVAVIEQLQDGRLRRLGQRLLYLEQPHLLSASGRQALAGEFRERLFGPIVDQGLWLTVAAARNQLEPLLLQVGGESKAKLLAFGAYLDALVADTEELVVPAV